MDLKEKKELFYILLRELENGSRLMGEYDSIPKLYGDILLYQVECHTVQIIGRYDCIKLYELAEEMNKTNSAVSQIIKKLVKKGLVYNFRNPDNNREVLLSLTDLGKKVYEEHEHIDYEAEKKLFALIQDLSIDDIKSYIKIQKIFNKQFFEDVKNNYETYNDYIENNK